MAERLLTHIVEFMGPIPSGPNHGISLKDAYNAVVKARDDKTISAEEWVGIMVAGIPSLDPESRPFLEQMQFVLAPVKGDGSNRINFGDFVQGFDVKRGEVSPSKHHLHEDNDRDGKKVDTLYKRSQSMLSIFHYMDTMDSETSEKVKEADWVKGCEQLRQGMSDSDKQHLAGAEALFAILDFDGSGEINLNKFLEGCRIVLKA